MPQMCKDCKVPYQYDWRLDYNVCPKCGNDKVEVKVIDLRKYRINKMIDDLISIKPKQK